MTGAGAGPASASECTPALIAGDMASLPQPWRLALEALAAVTAREGQPWSCPDARITLVLPSDHGPAQLEVADASGVRRRSVASPADLVPLGEAMLAKAFVLEVPANPPAAPLAPLKDTDHVGEGAAPAVQLVMMTEPSKLPAQLVAPKPPGAMDDAPKPPVAMGDAPKPPAPARRGPDLLVDLLAGARFTGPTRAMLMGPELRAVLMFERWFGGLIARYDSAIGFLQPVPDQFSLASVSVGFTGGYRVLTARASKAPVELTAALEPTLAVALMGGQEPGQSEPDIDARVDMRLGARLGAAIPISERLRAVCALGGEGTPAALFTDRRSRRRALPSLPGYLIGLSIGIEVAAIQ